MREWLKRSVLKTEVPLRVPGVRISPPPPMNETLRIKRAIRKSDFINALPSRMCASKQSQLLESLFESNSSLDEQVFLYLNNDIKNISDIEVVLKTIQISNNQKQKIKKIFITDEDLNLSNELFKVFNSEKIALFVGTGVSKICKLPLWDELARRALTKLLDGHYINYLEKDKLTTASPKQVITIFHKLINDKGILSNFYLKELSSEFPHDNTSPYFKLVQLEKQCSSKIIKITTNIDTLWEDAWQKFNDLNPISNETNTSAKKDLAIVADVGSKDIELKTDTLYKIHGTIQKKNKEQFLDVDKIVMTTEQYINAYRNDSKLPDFLRKVFSDYTVLFIGSGMSEFEILEHPLRDKLRKHYALVPTYIGEEHLFWVKSKYFQTLNITPIPYYRDFEGYERLVHVIDAWIKQINSRKSTEFMKEQGLLDKALRI